MPLDQPSGSLEVSVTATEGADILKLAGDLDIYTSMKLRDYLYDKALVRRAVVVIDLNSLDFMDSSGLAALVAAHKWLTFRGQRLVLACSGGQPSKVLKAVRLDVVLPTVPTVEDVGAFDDAD